MRTRTRKTPLKLITAEDREAIRTLLRKRRVTLRDTAGVFGVAQQTIEGWLAGRMKSEWLDVAIPAFAKGLELGVAVGIKSALVGK